MKKLILPFIIIFSISSCLKEEIPIKSPSPGDIETDTVGLTSDYRYQIYYNLALGSEVGRNYKKEWDLGFECSPEGYHVILNSSKLMYAAKTTALNFESITDTIGGYSWRTDAISGHLDSTAFNNWQSNPTIYLIDRGLDEFGKHQGFAKVLIESSDANAYIIYWSKIKDLTPLKMSIPKLDNVNFNFLLFDKEGIINTFEPNSNNWDLMFTQYSEKLKDGDNILPYLVVGAQINRKNTTAALAPTDNFDEVTLEYAQKINLSSNINQPGYDWKTFSLDAGTYQVDPSKIYIIKTQSAFYYKMRFIDYYNSNAEKGYPKFEFQKL